LSFRERLASPHAQTQPLQKPRLSTQNSTASSTSNRRASFQPPRVPSALEDTRASRPASSLASTSRRSSLLPQSRTRRESSTGRASPQALSASRLAMRRSDAQAKDARPPWRP
jgi:hypothetical protein